MDYLTMLREAHAELQQKREKTVCEMGKLIDELCRVLQKIEEVFSSPQVAILMERVTRQEALIAAEEQESALLGEYLESLRHPLSADVYGDSYMDGFTEPAYDESYDGFGA